MDKLPNTFTINQQVSYHDYFGVDWDCHVEAVRSDGYLLRAVSGQLFIVSDPSRLTLRNNG